MQRLKLSLRILHNELAVVVYLYCRDPLLFQFLKITENCKLADVSVPRNCAHQMHNAPIERKTLERTFRGRNKDW